MRKEEEQELKVSFTESEIEKLGLKKKNSCYIITQVDTESTNKK